MDSQPRHALEVPTRVAAAVLLLVSISAAGCRPPGVKATGLARVEWLGGADSSWIGACSYELSTRWATSLPHMIRLESDAGTDALVLSAARAWAAGEVSIPGDDAAPTQGRAFEGNTVRGSLHGTVRVTETRDSTLISVRGERRLRDTVTFIAVCRLGPVSR